MAQRRKISTAFPQRKRINGPESDLISKFIRCGLSFAKGKRTLLQEPRMPTGFPDLVIAFCRQTSIKNSGQRHELDVAELKLLHHLSSIRTTTVSELVTGLLWDKKALDRHLKKLEKANLIRINPTTVRLKSLRNTFVVSKIVAVEAKIAHWRKALEQAVANTWFASHSYVLLPPNGVISRVADQARKFGIGVLVFDGQYTKEVLRPFPNRIPSSYGSWLINEWVIKTMMRERVYDRRGRASVCLSRT